MKGKETILRAADIMKVYHRGSEEIRAVDGITLDIAGASSFPSSGLRARERRP